MTVTGFREHTTANKYKSSLKYRVTARKRKPYRTNVPVLSVKEQRTKGQNRLK